MLGSPDYLDKIKHEALETSAAHSGPLHQALRKAQTPQDFQKIMAGLLDTMDQLFAGRLAQSGDTIACQAGCFYCCYIKVDALPLEIFHLVEYIKEHFTPDQIEEIRDRAASNRKRIADLSGDAQRQTNIPCPLLQNGRCMCYGARPPVCRLYHSHAVAPCEAMYHGSANKDRRVVVQEITYTLAAVISSSKKVFKEEGFDSTAYDLSSALDEALSNPKCYKRWRQGKRAFSKDVVAKTSKEDDVSLYDVL